VVTAEDSSRVIEQRLRNRAIEALDWLADGDDGVPVAGGSGYSNGQDPLPDVVVAGPAALEVPIVPAQYPALDDRAAWERSVEQTDAMVAEMLSRDAIARGLRVARCRRSADLRDHLGERPGRCGGSAGGNLAAALLLRAKAEGLPMPAALVLLTPEIDLTESGDSFTTLAGVSVGLQPLHDVNLLYANGHDLHDLYLSSLFGDLSGFPPTLVICGTRDLFLSNAVRMHRKLREAGVDADLHIFDGRPHAGYGTRPKRQQWARNKPRSCAGISGSELGPSGKQLQGPWSREPPLNERRRTATRASRRSRRARTVAAAGWAIPRR
jgi:hypothetical protein